MTTVVTVVAAILLSAGVSYAHRVSVFAYVEGDKVQVEGYFGKKNKAMNCRVDVLDSGGKTILTGKTDKQGLFSFPVARLGKTEGDVTIILTAGQGHKAKFLLEASEYSTTQKSETPPEQDQSAAPSSAPGKKAATLDAGEVKLPSADNLRRIVEAAVKKENAPILRMLGKQRRLLMEMRDAGPTMRDIIGGIGWIFGIFGVAAFFMSRRKS